MSSMIFVSSQASVCREGERMLHQNCDLDFLVRLLPQQRFLIRDWTPLTPLDATGALDGDLVKWFKGSDITQIRISITGIDFQTEKLEINRNNLRFLCTLDIYGNGSTYLDFLGHLIPIAATEPNTWGLSFKPSTDCLIDLLRVLNNLSHARLNRDLFRRFEAGGIISAEASSLVYNPLQMHIIKLSLDIKTSGIQLLNSRLKLKACSLRVETVGWRHQTAPLGTFSIKAMQTPILITSENRSFNAVSDVNFPIHGSSCVDISIPSNENIVIMLESLFSPEKPPYQCVDPQIEINTSGNLRLIVDVESQRITEITCLIKKKFDPTVDIRTLLDARIQGLRISGQVIGKSNNLSYFLKEWNPPPYLDTLEVKKMRIDFVPTGIISVKADVSDIYITTDLKVSELQISFNEFSTNLCLTGYLETVGSKWEGTTDDSEALQVSLSESSYSDLERVWLVEGEVSNVENLTFEQFLFILPISKRSIVREALPSSMSFEETQIVVNLLTRSFRFNSNIDIRGMRLEVEYMYNTSSQGRNNLMVFRGQGLINELLTSPQIRINNQGHEAILYLD